MSKPFHPGRYLAIVCGFAVIFCLAMPWFVVGFIHYLEWVGRVAR